MVQTWNRILLKSYIERKSSAVPYRRIMGYQPNSHTQLVISYHDIPILGRYQSLWRDDELGWVLGRHTTKAVINRFMAETSLSAISLHQSLERHCRVSKHHVLFENQLALFSVNGYRGSSTSWTNLYHVSQMEALARRHLHVNLKDGFSYEFDQVSPNIEGRIGEALRMQKTVLELVRALHQHLGRVVAVNENLGQLNHLRDGQVEISLEQASNIFNYQLHRQTQLECLNQLAHDMDLQLSDKELLHYARNADKKHSLY